MAVPTDGRITSLDSLPTAVSDTDLMYIVSPGNVALGNSYKVQASLLKTYFQGVAGPAVSTDNAIARFDGTTGDVIQNSGITIDDSAVLHGTVAFTPTGTISATTVQTAIEEVNADARTGPYRDSRVFGGAPALVLTSADLGFMVYVDTYNGGVNSQGLIAVTLPSGLGAGDEGAVIGIIKYPVTSGSINGHAGQVTVTDGSFTHYLSIPYKTATYQWTGTVWRLVTPDLQTIRGNHVTIHRTITSTPFDANFENRDQGSVLRAVTGAGGVGGNVQVNLPLISTTVVPGASYLTSDAWIRKSGNDNYRAIFVPQNGESINGIAYVSFYSNFGQGVISLTNDFDTLHLESDGSEWSILGGRLATDGLVENALSNSAFKLWGGATSSTARADGAAFAPFWNILTETASVNLSRLDNPWEGARYAARVTQNQAAAQRFGAIQWVVGSDSVHRRGVTHIFSAKMRSNVGGTIIRYALLSWTGTEDAPTIDVVNNWSNGDFSPGQFFIGSNLVVTQYGFMNLINANQVYDLVPLQGQFSTSLNNVMLFVWTESPAAQNTTVDVSLCMLTPGGVPRLHRDDSIYEEQLAAGAGFTNTRLAKTAAYSVVNADRGKTIALGGSAFYTLTFDAPTGYDPAFSVMVLNEDTGRAKNISMSGGSTFILWPGQTCTVYNSNNVWKSDGPKRWILSTNVTFHVASGGSDSNDGLSATGNGPLATVQAAYDRFTKFVDTRRFQGIISVGAGSFTTSGDGLHADGQPLGAGGGGQLNIVGAGSGSTTIRSTAGTALAVYYDTVIGIQGVTLQADVGNGLIVDRGGFVQISDDVAFGACGVAHIVVSDNATLLAAGTVRLNGNPVLAHLAAGTGAFIRWSANIVFDANITASYFVLANIGANVQYSGATITLGAFTFTGRRYYADTTSVLYSSTGVADTYFPGTLPGQNLTNAVVDNVAADILAAQLPAFGSGDVSFAADGGAGTIANDAVTNAKLANMATATVKGRTTAGTGDPEDLTVAQAQALLAQSFITVRGTIDFSAAGDSPVSGITFALPPGYTRYRVGFLCLSGASASIAAATFGVFTAAGGAGTAIIPAATAITVSSSAEDTNNNMQLMGITNQNTQSHNQLTLYPRVAATAAATATISIYIHPVS